MTYKINKTDGSLLAEIIDSEINTTATDLALIGKNVTGYGEYLNENFIKLLENFSSTSEPNNPIVGQLWFDTSENRLKVYDGNNFRIGSGPIVSGTAPISAIPGDFWIDNNENRLYFYTATGRYPSDKIYNDSDGKAGFQVDSVVDVDGNSRTILKLTTADALVGIFSKHDEFTPQSSIFGYSGTIKPGFNAGTINGFKLHARATSADALVDGLGNQLPSTSFMRTNANNTTNGSITIRNGEPLTLGVGQENTIVSNSAVMQLRSNRSGQDFKITTRYNVDSLDAITIRSVPLTDQPTGRVGVFNVNPQAMLHIGEPGLSDDLGNPACNVIIEGNLTVNGTTTTINSNVVSIDDAQIVLGDTQGSTPTDLTANTGGVILKGSTDKEFIWRNTTSSWTSSEHLNLKDITKAYKINGVDVLTSTSLGSGITSAAGLGITAVSGIVQEITIDNININGNTISTTTGNLVLSPTGAGVVDVVNSRVTNLLDPLPAPTIPGAPDPGKYDAVTRNYVDTLFSGTVTPWLTVPDPGIGILSPYESSAGQRLLINTTTAPVTVVLPNDPNVGDSIRFIDYDSTFDTNNLIVKRYRGIDVTGGTSGLSATGTYTNVTTTTVTGIGSGLVVDIEVTLNGTTYNDANTIVTVVSHGDNYADGNQIKILGTDIGGTSPANDLSLELILLPILGQDSDLIVTKVDNAFGLIYVGGTPGWKYIENLDVSGGVIEADLVGDVTGDVTGDVIGNLTGNVVGNVVGNILGDLTGNVAGDVIGNLTGDVIGNLTGDVIGNLTGDVTGNVTGDLTGYTISGVTSLVLNAARNVELNIPIQIKGYDTSTRNTLSYRGLIYNTDLSILQYYDGAVGVWQSVGTDNNNSMPRFKLPTYTAAEIATLAGVQAGEIVFNSDTAKPQVFDGTIWNDLY